MEIQLHLPCWGVIIRCSLPLKVTWGKTLSSQTDTTLFDPQQDTRTWERHFCKLLCELGLVSPHVQWKKDTDLESKELGSNPAPSTECQFKLTKHRRLLFPYLWCRNWCPPCRMTRGTKWVIHKPWTSSVLGKHCSSHSSVRQSESPPPYLFL